MLHLAKIVTSFIKVLLYFLLGPVLFLGISFLGISVSMEEEKNIFERCLVKSVLEFIIIMVYGSIGLNRFICILVKKKNGEDLLFFPTFSPSLTKKMEMEK